MQPKPVQPITLPEQLEFNWERDYAPYWTPGSSAFWLAPEPGEIPAGVYPLPTIKPWPGGTQADQGLQVR